jgi:ribonuclease P protein component
LITAAIIHTQAQGEVCFEANVPTEPQTQVKDAWLPDPDAHARGTQHAPAPAPEGPASPDPSMNAGRRPHAFPKHLRLLRRNEFRRVYEEGKRRSTPLCTVFFRSNGLAHSRLGLTVPAAVGNAPLRNRLKRRVREVFRLNQAAIPAGWDIVVNPRKGVAQAPFASLTRELLRLFPSAHPPVASAPGTPSVAQPGTTTASERTS